MVVGTNMSSRVLCCAVALIAACRGKGGGTDASDATVVTPDAPDASVFPDVDELVLVDLAVDRGEATHRAAGILFGISETDPSDDVVLPLRVPMYRTAEYYDDALHAFDRMTEHGASVVFNMSAGRGFATPWPVDDAGWAQWETDWEATVSRLVTEAAGAGRAPQWDVWNEPTLEDFWPVANDPDHAHFFETWRRAVTRIRSRDPDAEIVGPSASLFDLDFLEAFLRFAKDNDALPDILSWHEFGPSFGLDAPDQLAGHVDEVRAVLASLGIDLARFQINEWLGPDEHHKPGAAVWYLANLERAGVESAARTCGWNPAEDDCHNASLAGLLTPSGKAPRSIWWAHKAYAEVTGRLVELTPSASLDGVASIDAENAAIHVLLGNHAESSVTTELRVRSVSFPDGCAHVVADLIVNTELEPLAAPTREVDEELVVDGTTLRVPLPAAGPWDAWAVAITACE